jgi:hypothetical protein
VAIFFVQLLPEETCFHDQSISLVAIIGFDPDTYDFDEGGGTGFFTFRVLQGNIAFPVSVLFSTVNGSAVGMKCLLWLSSRLE